MGTALRYRLNILPGEVVLSGTPIVIHFDGPISPNSLGGIGVKGQPAKIQVADDALSLLVVESPAKIPAEIAAIQATQLHIGKLRTEHLAMRRDAEVLPLPKSEP